MNLSDPFFLAYLECALWSSTDNSGDSGGKSLDKNYNENSFPREVLEKLYGDCEDFRAANKELLEEYYKEHGIAQAGHDFWLSRNGHGAGFFDRGKGYRALQDAARVYGTVDIYVGDDGLLYI